jgi:hypothetical protein
MTQQAGARVPYVVGRVTNVREKYAIVLDDNDRHIDVRIDIQRGQLPRVGELWIIDRIYGAWTFAAVVQATPPEVGGEVIEDSALRSTIDALAEIGIVDDQTQTSGVSPPPPPVVAGDKVGNPALTSLISALVQLGLIEDQTS